MREMKDSGVAWIGEIPKDWKISKIKNISVSLKSGGTPDSSKDEFYVDKEVGIPWVAIADMSGKPYITYTQKYITEEARKSKNLTIFEAGTILYAMYASVGKVSVLGVKATINQALLAISLKKGIDDAYCTFALNAWEPYIISESNGTTQFNLNANKVANLQIPMPPENRQRIISDCINGNCVKVDSLIANVQAQIEKLKAYKQSLITEVVTKGLDPSAPMKDSGVDWIGEIPMHWNIVATKYLFEIFSGATPKSEIIANWDGNIIWITPADYKTDDVFVSCGRRNLSEQGFASCSTSIIPANSIIFSKRAPIGAVAINTVELCTNQGCLSCVNKDESNINAKFFYYVMAIATEHYELLGSGTTFKEISASNFANFVLPWPAIDEQIAMVEYLDDKCTMIAQLIAIKQKKINKLTEYKKSIIYEYVTGKKEVS